MKVLAFGCHPDDVEFMAAGTLYQLADRGWEIHMATMTGGEVGSTKLKSQQIREIRVKEAQRAAKLIGGEYHYAGGHDLDIFFDRHHQMLAARVVRMVDPDVVLTHSPADYLLDHEVTSKLVRNAAFIASVPLYDTGAPLPATDKIPYLYYWNAFGGQDIFGNPIPVTFGIDVSAALDKKKKMLEVHASQREWLAYISSGDAYVDDMVRLTAEQGKVIGREYGECFIQHLGEGHPRDNILAHELEGLSFYPGGGSVRD